MSAFPLAVELAFLRDYYNPIVLTNPSSLHPDLVPIIERADWEGVRDWCVANRARLEEEGAYRSDGTRQP